LLHEDAGWNKNSLGGNAPTMEEMTTVPASLTDIFIRGEYSSIAGDICHLDNLILGGPVMFANIEIENHDGQIDPGEQVNLLIARNQDVLTAEGINGLLSSPDPNVTVIQDSSDWANLNPGADEWSLERLPSGQGPHRAGTGKFRCDRTLAGKLRNSTYRAGGSHEKRRGF